MNIDELNKLKRHFLKSDESNIDELIKTTNEVLINNFGKAKKYNGILQNNINNNWLNKYNKIPENVTMSDEVLHDSMNVFAGQIRWNSLATMHNINPPILLDSVIGSMVANLYNPNVLWDYVSANAQEMERQISKQISELCGWDNNNSSGIFTFGGKACLFYAVRLGLNRAINSYATNGYPKDKRIVVITSQESHYTIDYVCSFLGIGINNCIRIPTNKDKMDMDIFEHEIIKCMKNDILIAAIIVSGGNTINNSMDSLKEIHNIVEKACNRFKLTYKPYIHFDTVVGWPWLFFKYYNFKKNELDISENVKKILKENYDLISQVEYADSMGIDFHKIGFAPYQSSIFMAKNGNELYSINKNTLEKNTIKKYGNNFTQHYSIEHSRSFAPIYSGWLALQIIGKKGFISYLAYLTELSFIIRKELEKIGFIWLNRNSKGFATVFWCSYRNDTMFDDILDGNLEIIENQNIYLFNFYKSLESEKYSVNRYVFAFMPDYIKSKKGHNIATLRIFPMSFELQRKDIEYMINDIKKIKEQFDNNYQNGNTSMLYDELDSIPR